MSKFNREYYEKRISWKEFQINEFLTVKLKKRGPKIYIKGKEFDYRLFHRDCETLFLMHARPLPEDVQYSSIDEYFQLVGWGQYDVFGEWAEGSHGGYILSVDRKTEYWGCCSNLQAWAENDYNPNLLRYCVAAPLLKALTDAGDPIALNEYKGIIKEKALSKHWINELEYIADLKYLDKVDFQYVLTQMISDYFKEEFADFDGFKSFVVLTKLIKNTELFLQNFELIEQQVLTFFKLIEGMDLLKEAKEQENRALEKYLSVYPRMAKRFLEIQAERGKQHEQEILNEEFWRKCNLFSELLVSITDTKLMMENREKFLNYYRILCKQIISKEIDYYEYCDLYMFAANFVEIITQNSLTEEFLTEFQQMFPKLPIINTGQDNLDPFPNVYFRILNGVKGTPLSKEKVFQDWNEQNAKTLKNIELK